MGTAFTKISSQVIKARLLKDGQPDGTAFLALDADHPARRRCCAISNSGRSEDSSCRWSRCPRETDPRRSR